MFFVFDSSFARFLNVWGIVIWPFMFISFTREETPPSLLKHEFVHVHQVRREGVIWFYLQYLFCLARYFLKYGNLESAFVDENEWEAEAYTLQEDPLTEEEMKECNWKGPKTDRIWKGLRTKMLRNNNYGKKA